jgi:uncharacterized repeat protein (TIGR03803 family)
MKSFSQFSRVVLALLISIVFTPLVVSQTYSVLHSFAGVDGATPSSSLTLDADGNLYGTTRAGGASGAGTVFKLDSAGNESVLYNFTGKKDGDSPQYGVVLDSAGNLYGTTVVGGASKLGVFFKLDRNNHETVLHSFGTGLDGRYPTGDLFADSAGNFYGTTDTGGDHNWGTVFRLDQNGTETVLYSFKGSPDASNPRTTLIRDSAGNFYGLTVQGGPSPGWGTIFKLDPSGTETVLYNFAAGKDGRYPFGGLVRDSLGNFYGTTSGGGNVRDEGTIFKLNKAGKKSVLYRFNSKTASYGPLAGLVRDSAGNLYGTTAGAAWIGRTLYHGTVFKLDAHRVPTLLHLFTGGNDGGLPTAALIQDSAGNLYGTATVGGTHNLGVVFKITP